MQRTTHATGVITYQFESLSNLPVYAHVSTRHGGVSPDPWKSLNFSVKRGDTQERVDANRQRLAQALGHDSAAMIKAQQVHGTGIAKVDWSDAGQTIEATDGLITDGAGLPLGLVFADCVPVLLYDQRHRALGVIHAGWRGTVNGAAEALLWSMQAAYGTSSEDILAGIGPSIGPSSYQVGREVVDMARVKLAQADSLLHYHDGPDANPYFDLWEANVQQLITAGVAREHIELAEIDTATTTADFFSHRAERGRCGLFSMVAWLEKST